MISGLISNSLHFAALTFHALCFHVDIGLREIAQIGKSHASLWSWKYHTPQDIYRIDSKTFTMRRNLLKNVLFIMWFLDFVTVFNQSYTCQNSHYLGRNWVFRPFLIFLCYNSLPRSKEILPPLLSELSTSLRTWLVPKVTLAYFSICSKHVTTCSPWLLIWKPWYVGHVSDMYLIQIFGYRFVPLYGI